MSFGLLHGGGVALELGGIGIYRTILDSYRDPKILKIGTCLHTFRVSRSHFRLSKFQLYI